MVINRKTGQQVYKMGKPFKGNGGEYVEVLVSLTKPDKNGNKAIIQTMNMKNLINTNTVGGK